MTQSIKRRLNGGQLLACALITAACSADRLPSEPGILIPSEPGAQAGTAGHPQDTIKRYIVRLKASGGEVAARATALVQPHGGNLSHVFKYVFEGFVVEGISPVAAQAIAKSPSVEYVEEEGFSYASQVQTLTRGSEWGLDWIDQRSPPLNGQYSYSYTGAGVHIYIVDSGVRGGHIEFTGRIGNGTCKVSYTGGGCSPTIDQRNHGTRVPSVAAGTTTGVAKQAIIHSVRIDDGEGSARDGDMIAGFDWILYNRISPAVVNVSYSDGGAPGSFAVRDAQQRLVDNGITVVRAAGNINRDAFMYRPNRVTPALVVGSTTWDGFSLVRKTDSNYGTTVDLFGPGGAIRAARSTGDAEFGDDFLGTSAASPFVAGVAAQVLQANPFYGSGQVESTIKSLATYGVVNGLVSGDPNLFVFRY